MITPSTHLKPGPTLYREVRAAFVRQGTALATFCGQNDILKQHARACLLGERRGPRAEQIIQTICLAAFSGH